MPTLGVSGCIDADLDNLLSGQDRVDTAVALAQEALHSLRQQGPLLRRAFLNEMRIGGPGSFFSGDAETLPLQRIGEAFVELLRGQCPTHGSDSLMFGM